MNESITKTTCHFSPAASLAALGVKMKQLDLFGPIRQRVQIAQKTVKYTPIEKLSDAFISLLAGAHREWETSTVFCAVIRACSVPLDAAGAQNNRWSNKRWMPVRRQP